MQKERKQTPFSIALRAARSRSKLNRRELADLINVVPGTIEAYETGRAEPQLRQFFKLCAVLYTDPVTMYYNRRVEITPEREILDRITELLDGRRSPDGRRRPLYDYGSTDRRPSGRPRKETTENSETPRDLKFTNV